MLHVREARVAKVYSKCDKSRMPHLERVQHALACDYDLLRLFLNWQRANQRRNFLSRLPLGQLTHTRITYLSNHELMLLLTARIVIKH